MKKKIAIIGAGIAGLTLANFLKKFSDHDFIVYEKTDSLPLDEGYGIQLSANIIKILNQINFKNIEKDKLFHPNSLDFYSINDKKICDLSLTYFNNKEAKYTTLRRSVLIEFLKNEIYLQHIRFGKQIIEVSEIKNKILLKFGDNTNDLVDIVVGADGIFSNTRSFFEKKKSKPKFKKAIAIRTILKSKKELMIDENNISLFMGNNCHLVFYPINRNMELNLVCIIRNKDYDPDNLRTLIEQKIFTQNPKFINIFESDLKSWPLYSTSKILPSTNAKVFYIGDAFNGFLPTMAQGAGQSIESAFDLFELIKKENSKFKNCILKKDYQKQKLLEVDQTSIILFFIFQVAF